MRMRKLWTVVAVWCLAAMVFGQALFLPWQAVAQGEVGRPPLPHGIVRLPFNGEYGVTQVPGCHNHAWNPNFTNGDNKWNEMNVRAFDFGLPSGTEVLAAGDGHVFDIYYDPKGSLTVVIDHGDDVRSYYVHLSESWQVIGEPVDAGDPIGLSGESGALGQPHLHFAVTIGGDPGTSGVAANVNSLPGIPWILDTPNEDGYVNPCRPLGSEADIAIGGAVAQEPDAPEAAGEPMITAAGYDRNAAVDAAFSYLYQDNVFENDSAWYVSKVLWAGGLPMTDLWNDAAASGLTDPDILIPSISGGPGVPAAIPHDLVSYLVDNGFATSTELDWSDNAAHGAELGDVIAYDWEGDGTIDHVSVVTNINDDGYPEVSEHSPTLENRYWTRTFDDADWIENASPDSVAYLIRVSPITVPEF